MAEDTIQVKKCGFLELHWAKDKQKHRQAG